MILITDNFLIKLKMKMHLSKIDTKVVSKRICREIYIQKKKSLMLFLTIMII